MTDVRVRELASRFARLALAGVGREYPHKLDHVTADASDLRRPKDLHPAFYGCYDWHSAVHGHWLLARALRRGPGHHAQPEQVAAAAALDEHLTPDNIGAEVAYLLRPLSRAFERTYGWAWALKLHEELGRGARDLTVHPDEGMDAGHPRSNRDPSVAGAAAHAASVDPGRRAPGPTPPSPERAALSRKFARWAGAMGPLADAIDAKYRNYLPRLSYPVRTGVHPCSAFGLLFAWEWAAWRGDDGEPLREVVHRAAIRFFGDDRDYPAHLEPSGSDFFSPALMEAHLMGRVLEPGGLASWFARFLPGAARGEPRSLFEPAEVSDRTDPQIVHLDGLNLSRAWCMRSVASILRATMDLHPWAEPTARTLLDSADRHEAASLQHVASGAYEGEHWLGTFAMLAVDGS